MMTRRSLVFAAVAALGLAIAPPARAADADPAAFVSQLADQAMQIMVGKGIDDQDRASRFRTLFVAGVDLNEIGRRVLGRHWRTSTPEQQQDFLRLFEDIVVLTWSTRFKDYGSDLRHTILGVVDDGDRGLTVSSRVDRVQLPPIALQWRLKRIDTGFRVIDLIVEGSSMAITFQSEYAAVIRANGDRVDGLLAAMRTKVAELQGAPRS